MNGINKLIQIYSTNLFFIIQNDIYKYLIFIKILGHLYLIKFPI